METANKLIVGFVMLMIGVVLIGTIADQANDKTNVIRVNSETHVLGSTYATGRNITDINPNIVYNITNAPTGWKSDDCPITNFVLRNASGSALTLTTHYTFTASTGKFQLVNSAAVNNSIGFAANSTVVSYDYCGDDYLNSTWGRTVLNLVAGFFAIAILMVALALFYSVAKDTGIM